MCVKERERRRKRVCVCVCVCMTQREKDRKRKRHGISQVGPESEKETEQRKTEIGGVF